MLIDSLLKDEFKYEIYLCKPSDLSIVSCLSECAINRKIKKQLRSVDELEFVIPKYWDDNRSTSNDNFDSTVSGMALLLETFVDDVVQEQQYFWITEAEPHSDDKDYKVVKAYSYQYRWNKIKVRDFITLDSNGDPTVTQLYDPVNPWDDNDPTASGIVNYILEVKLLDTWSVNYITSGLGSLTRSFDISVMTLLEVVEMIENDFNCIVFFDTYNKTIDIKGYDDLPEETGLILHDENFVKKLKQKIKVDEIVTRLYVDGDADEITSLPTTIIPKNVTAQPYIDDFTYFRTSEYMSSGLLSALTTYDSVLSSNQSTFDTRLSELSVLQGELDVLDNELADLRVDLYIYENKEDLAIQNGGSYDSQTYTYWHGLVTTQEGLITTKDGEITSKEAEITAKEVQITAVATAASYESNFTTAQLQELLNFVNEENVQCSTTDEATLFDFGEEVLSRKSQPPIEFDLDVVDLFDSTELSYTWDKLVLGSKVELVSEVLGISEQPRVVSYTHDPDGCSLSVSVSNKEYLNDDLNYVTALFAQSKRGANIISQERKVYKDYVQFDKDTLNSFITSPINTSTNTVSVSSAYGAVDGVDGMTIGRRGMVMKDVDSVAGQMKILGNRIVFTQDNWVSYSLAITPAGIQTDGEFKLFSDDSSVEINGSQILIDGSNGADTGFKIKNGAGSTVFALDGSGNIVMTGSITITGGTDLDDIPDGSTYKRTTANEVTGAGLGYTGFDGSANVKTGVKPSTAMGNPSVEGLYMGSDYIGFHTGNGAVSGWVAYMKNNAGTGEFRLGSTSSSNYMDWNGSTLTIKGNLTAGTISIGSGDDVFKVDTTGNMWLGDANLVDAPFTVNNEGELTCTGAVVAGQLKHSVTGDSYVELSSNFADLSVVRTAGVGGMEYGWRIYDNSLSYSLITTWNSVEHNHIDLSETATKPRNTWDFSLATVTGLTVKFS